MANVEFLCVCETVTAAWYHF